jgi:hypothetical protein
MTGVATPKRRRLTAGGVARTRITDWHLRRPPEDVMEQTQ